MICVHWVLHSWDSLNTAIFGYSIAEYFLHFIMVAYLHIYQNNGGRNN